MPMKNNFNFKYNFAIALISKLLKDGKITEQEYEVLELKYKKAFC